MGVPVTNERWRVEVDATTCAASALCVSLAPARFRLDDGTARPVAEHIDPDDDVIDAAESCPTGAISVYSADGELLSPKF